jgi:hypothetical protein
MPGKQALVILDTDDHKQQSCDRLEKYSEIIVWHLTPCWKIILVGSDPGKIMFSSDFFFAWFDLCQTYMFLNEFDNYF